MPITSEIFSIEACIPELEAETKDAALERMVSMGAAAGVFPKKRTKEIAQAILAREGRGSTGLGRGIAIPHAKVKGLRNHGGVVAHVPGGLAFMAIDGEPVDVLVMVVSPEGQPDEHLEMLRWLSSIARDPDFGSFLRQACTPAAMMEVLLERAG